MPTNYRVSQNEVNQLLEINKYNRLNDMLNFDDIAASS